MPLLIEPYRDLSHACVSDTQEKIEENRERFRKMVEKIKEEVSGLVEKED